MLCLAVLAGCAEAPEATLDVATYEREIADWHLQREARLKGPEGWLNLAGLFWLEAGRNTLGSDPDNDIVIPQARAAMHIGELVVEAGAVRFTAAPGADVNSDGNAIDTLTLIDDDPGPATVLTHADLAFFVIDREGRLGIRLRDYRHPILTTFSGIESYPATPRWRLDAQFRPYAEPRQISVATVVEGLGWEPIAPGVLEFEVDGEIHDLEVLDSGEGFFVMFADATTGATTYPAGRYLYAEPPGTDGTTVLDFNKAYNPPCAFNEFATCPLPPRHNFLSVAIEAGEKYSDALHAPSR
jgi:uncharacterized protein (DUF1684 family)